MKEVTRVHLAKTTFDIEIDAKKQLEKYLVAIEKRMEAEVETMREIEARMVELLAERGVGRGQVISSDDVIALQEQLGEPQEFGDSLVEPTETEEGEQPAKPTRRLMRDTDNAIFGGVCSGLAAYFNIDALIVRLLAVVLLFVSAGSLILIYVIMLIVMPPARTAADRLIMAGKPVTLEALKASTESNSVAYKKNRNQRIAKAARIALSVFILMIMLGVLIGLLVGGYLGYDTVNWLDGMAVQTWAFALLWSLILGGLALVVLLGLLAYSAFNWRVGRSVGIAMVAMLIAGTLAVAGIAISGTQVGKIYYRDRQSIFKTEEIQLPKDIEAVKSAKSVGDAIIYSGGPEGPVRAELRYALLGKNHTKPEVKVYKDGEVLRFEVTSLKDADCPVLLMRGGGGCDGFSPEIKIYGLSSTDHHSPSYVPAAGDDSILEEN